MTILLQKCHMKSFEEMNILIKTILKFCTTNQLFELKRLREIEAYQKWELANLNWIENIELRSSFLQFTAS